MIGSLFLAALLLSPQETELKARLPERSGTVMSASSVPQVMFQGRRLALETEESGVYRFNGI